MGIRIRRHVSYLSSPLKRRALMEDGYNRGIEEHGLFKSGESPFEAICGGDTTWNP